MGSSVTAPVADFGQALSALLRRYLAGARAAVAELPGGPRGFQVMSIAAGGACRNQAAIAEALGLDRTVMTYLVDDLENGGFLIRRPDPADRRSRQLVLTDQGIAYHAAAERRIGEVEREVLAALPDADAKLFRELLSRTAVGDPAIGHDACEVAADSKDC